jgi:hypothetical protein
MNLKGKIPLTFINGTNNIDKSKNQIAYYDCMSGPYKTDGSILETGQFCTNTPPHSLECIQRILSETGCTSAGAWYREGLPTSLLQSNLTYIRNWINTRILNADTEPDTFNSCYGINTRSSCAEFIGTNAVPSKDCLQELYHNTISRTKLGSTSGIMNPYSAAGENFLNYRGLNVNTDRYCRPQGALNPAYDPGFNTLSNIAKNGNGDSLRGIAAVNKYLSDTYKKSIDNTLDIRKSDTSGGRHTSWINCFGIDIAGSGAASCQPIMGKSNVYLLENSGGYDPIPGSTTYPNTYYIWGNRVYSDKTYTFYVNYCGNAPSTAYINGHIRNAGGLLKINGNTITPTSTAAGTFANISVAILQGSNSIVVKAVGTMELAGFWISLKQATTDSDSIVSTNHTWRCEEGSLIS